MPHTVTFTVRRDSSRFVDGAVEGSHGEPGEVDQEFVRLRRRFPSVRVTHGSPGPMTDGATKAVTAITAVIKIRDALEAVGTEQPLLVDRNITIERGQRRVVFGSSPGVRATFWAATTANLSPNSLTSFGMSRVSTSLEGRQS